jgi:hypothetical protein
MPAHVREVAAELIRHPVRNLLFQWNWKSALLSPAIRGGFILAANATAGPAGALSALSVEVLYRTLTAGFCGAVVESFRLVEPYWAGQLTVLVAVPAVSDALDILIHRSLGTPKLGWSVVVSISLTVASTAFNYFAMRRGAFIVGSGRRTIFHDLAMVPALLFAFLSIPFRQVLERLCLADKVAIKQNSSLS